MQDSQAGTQQPHHHFTTEEWQRIEGAPEFRQLVSVKRRFTIPATIVFVIYYFSLPVLVGYYPELMSRKVLGNVSLAYLFALSQFVVAWAIMGLYLWRARHFDELERQVVAKTRAQAGGAASR